MAAITLLLALTGPAGAVPPAVLDVAPPRIEAPPRALEERWLKVPALVDVRHESSRDLGLVPGGDPVRLDLPWGVVHEGQRHVSLRVGPGWVELLPADPQASPLRVDVLAGVGVEVEPGTATLFATGARHVAIRWTALRVPPGGTATVELLIERSRGLTAQYLRVPASARAGLAAGRLTTVAPSATRGASAFRWRAPERPVLVPPGGGLEPAHDGPAPAGCDPNPRPWCEYADGPLDSLIYLNESFDDGGAIGRGWLATDLWHEIPYATCAPGATFDPGSSFYHGVDGTCAYENDRVGSLVSPPIGPVVAGTKLVFASRIGHEGGGFDLAQLYVNGTLLGDMPTTLDPALWYDFNPIDLSAWAGQVIQVEFFFQSDTSVTDLGWMVDDVVIWNDSIANPNCVLNAGRRGTSPCDQRVSDVWTFDESQFCQNCAYSFYVLVECGREMHLPLDDMEGADVRVWNVVTGAPVPLRCVNQTALADAGLGPYPSFDLPGAGGAGCLDCCPTPAGCEQWWGPPFDVTDPGGHVSWGLPSCDAFVVYDSNGNGEVSCPELPATCGGELPLLSPGEIQVMDCSINDESGLCGLYRVEIISGGNVWSLFSNCDGTTTPQFRIFHDCTEAWAAYEPLPEMAIANLETAGGCPALDVTFDLVNLGCEAFDGDVGIRITSDCVPPDVLDWVELGPFEANSTRPISVPFTASCSPVRIEVFADPDDLIAECTESPTVAACRQEEGVDSLAAFACGCTSQLDARAGADVFACPGDSVLLDGSASTAVPCTGATLYRWLDGAGAEVRGWDPDPTFAVNVAGCPDGADYTLEVQCEGEPCSDPDTVRVGCLVPAAEAGADIRACVGSRVVLDGSASSVAGCANIELRWLDPSGAEARGWGPSPTLALDPFTCADAGDWTVEARCATGSGCSAAASILVECVSITVDAGTDRTTCEGEEFVIDDASATATGCTTVLYQWLDVSGTPITPVLDEPTLTATFTDCPGAATLVLVAACADPGFEDCGGFDTVLVTCPQPDLPVPTALAGCLGTDAELSCGTAGAGVTYSWDLDVSIDSDGDGDPANDADATGCDLAAPFAAGTTTARVTASDGTCAVSADVDVTVSPPATPAEVTGLRVAASTGSWSASWDLLAGATTYRVVRGPLATFTTCPSGSHCYDHAADDPAGRGACDSGGGTSFADPDDLRDGQDSYYLVVGLGPCGEEGPVGEGNDGVARFPRDPRTPTAGCP